MPFFITNEVFNSEGNTGTTTFTFTVTRTNPVGSASVNYTTAPAQGNSATSGVDFIATSGLLEFANGETTKTVIVSVNGDTTFEPDEFFNVILSNPVGDTIGFGTGTGGIRNDDAALPTVSITPTGVIPVSEGNSGTTAYTFSVALSTPTTQPITVNYSTNDGTATLLDNDYQNNDSTLTFLPGGPLTQTITVLVNGDTQLEPTETFTVSLNSATNANINPNASFAAGTIVNDELTYTLTASDATLVLEGNSGSTLRTFVINRSGATTQASTLNLVLAGSATLGTDYTLNGVTGTGVSLSGNTIQFAAGATTAVITLAVQGDTQNENDETILLSLTDPAGVATIAGSPISTTIVNDDVVIPTLPIVSISASDNAAEAGSDLGTFTINRTGDTSTPLTVSYTIGGTATNGLDYTPALTGTVTIPVGQLSVDIPIPPVDDLAVEPDESVTLTLIDGATYDLGTVTAATVTITDNDFLPPPPLPTVSITATDSDAAEVGNNSGTFTITRSGDTSEALTVLYTVAGTATSGIDYASLVQTATIPVGQTSIDVTVAPIDDTDVEGNETVSLTLTDGGIYDLGVTTTATVTITDNDSDPLPTVSITASDPNAAEAGNDPGTFTITRTGDTSEALTVSYTVGGTAAIEGTDYTPPLLSGTVTIPAGQSSATITITPIDDLGVEGNETVNLTLTSNAAYDLGTATAATVTIADNDSDSLPPPLPTVSITAIDSDLDAAEAGVDPGAFTITRTGDTTEALTVSYTVGGTATNGTDYTTITESVIIPAGQSAINVTITPVDDLDIEGAETVNLTLSSNAAYNLDVATATVTIADNDFPPPPLPTVSITAADSDLDAAEAGTDPGLFTITRTGDTSEALTVSYTVSGTATNGIDYNAITETVIIPAGQSSVNVTITPVDDLDIEGAETVNLTLTGNAAYNLDVATATVTIADNDFPPPPLPTVSITAADSDLDAAEAGADPAAFTITRTGDTTEALTVSYTVSGTATNGTDYTTITESVIIPAGQSAISVTITPTDDLDVEGAETVNLTLSSNATYALSTATTATVTIADNDSLLPPPLPTISIDNVSLSEGNNDVTTFTFTVSLSTGSSSVVTVDYATIDGFATATSDYTVIPLTTLTFAPGQTSQTIAVNVQGDLDVETDETFFVNLSNPVGTTIAVPQGIGTILNEDVPVIVNAPPIAIADQASVTEGQAVTIAVLENDSDPDGNPLTIDSFTNPSFGTLVRNNDGTFTYQANLDFAGTDSFTYQISDGQGGFGQATVTITIDPLNLIGTDCCDRLIGTNTGNRIEGRGGNDWIDGRGGNDWLNGEVGWDTLIGGLGADRFVFASSSAFNPCSLGVDTIVDFDRSQGDAIVLSRTTFTALSSLVGDSLHADDFAVINSACNGASLAAASVARIVFNQATGDLFYNQNGSCCGLGSGGRFATLSVNSSTTPLQASDFRVIA